MTTIAKAIQRSNARLKRKIAEDGLSLVLTFVSHSSAVLLRWLAKCLQLLVNQTHLLPTCSGAPNAQLSNFFQVSQGYSLQARHSPQHLLRIAQDLKGASVNQRSR